MKLFFVTENDYKFREAQLALQEFGIELVQARFSKTEDKDASLEEVAGSAAAYFAAKLQKPVVVDDTGIFFSAYKNFPGQHPKWLFRAIG